MKTEEESKGRETQGILKIVKAIAAELLFQWWDHSQRITQDEGSDFDAFAYNFRN